MSTTFGSFFDRDRRKLFVESCRQSQSVKVEDVRGTELLAINSPRELQDLISGLRLAGNLQWPDEDWT